MTSFMELVRASPPPHPSINLTPDSIHFHGNNDNQLGQWLPIRNPTHLFIDHDYDDEQDKSMM